MLPEWKEYLKQIWFNPKHPGAFAGPDKLYKVVKKEGKVKLDCHGYTNRTLTDYKRIPLQS